MSNAYKKIFKSRSMRLKILKFLRFIPDKAMLKLEYRIKVRKPLNLNDPQTLNEKLQWLKLYNRKNIQTTMVDKIAVKDFVREKIGEKYVIPTYGAWERFDDIDFNALPEQFVLKCNHDSGSIVICKDKSELDLENAREVLTNGLTNNAYYYGREWPYLNVKPRIFAEQFIEDKEYEYLPVYKILCFNGEPKIIQTIQNDKQPDETVDYFDTDWNLLEFTQEYPNSAQPFTKPEKLDEMLALARKLSQEESFLRVDFYTVNGRVYFSEFTFFTDSGFGQFYPESWDTVLGQWLTLPSAKQ